MAVTLTDGESAEITRALIYWRQNWREPAPFSADMQTALTKFGLPGAPLHPPAVVLTAATATPAKLQRRGGD